MSTKAYKPVEIAELANASSKKEAPLLPLLKQANLERVAISLGHGVDPDGLASQVVMAAIVTKLGAKQVNCFYRGTFNRSQNKAARSGLNLQNLKPEEEFTSAEDYTCIISVDGPPGSCPAIPHFVFDHHEQDGVVPKVGSDVRLIGATSSIVWEYALAVDLDFTSEEGQKLATALAIGIVTDTKNCTTDICSDLDYEALTFCLSHKDNKIYKSVLNYPRPTYYNDFYVSGWNNKIIESSLLVTGIGYIPEGRSGVISDLAEKFAETEGVATAVVFAIVDAALEISVRSSNPALNVNEFVKHFGNGGGKPGAGRVSISLPLFQNIPTELKEELYNTCFKIVKHKAIQIASDKK